MENSTLGKDKKIVLPAKGQEDLNEKLESFKLQLESMTEMFRMIRKMAAKSKTSKAEGQEVSIINHDGLPLSTSYIGLTSRSPYPYILIVDQDGYYRIGDEKFTSLSAAAEHVSGVRRSGWTFWRLLDGRTLKEVYKDK